MILAAGLLVLLGLGLFVAGILTGVTAYYWACVAACLVAAVLLIVVRRRIGKQMKAAGKAPAKAPVAVEPEPAASAEAAAPARNLPDPPVEDVEVTDLLLVVDLKDEVLVIDEHPRYHLAGCVHVAGRTTIPLPVDEARTDGFTPCAVCAPDRNLAERARARK